MTVLSTRHRLIPALARGKLTQWINKFFSEVVPCLPNPVLKLQRPFPFLNGKQQI